METDRQGSGSATVGRDFYLQPPAIVAQRLLGKLLVRRLGGATLIGRIVETEAYLGGEDPASHAFRGPTARNQVMFGPPGHAYVYFIYGMHFCVNVTCEPEGRAGAVLLRALEPLAGVAEMIRLRRLPPGAPPRLLTSGPGRLCQALGITRSELNGVDYTDPNSDLQIHADEWPEGQVLATPRIGIRQAAERPLRFLVAGNRFVSASSPRGRSSTSGRQRQP
jgi:DNA-3-methyladenine glycosylase